MQPSDLNLKALELFRLVAKSGSLQVVGEESGLAPSTISHHLRKLEEQMGVALLDHAKRPMVLTPAGGVFLKNVEAALSLIRKARAEATAGNFSETQQLRLGLIEDFDSDIAPELAVFLARAMPDCDFVHSTRLSKDILTMLGMHRLDIGVAVRPARVLEGLLEVPFLKDPYVIAVPSGFDGQAADLLAGQSDLPFLRYSRDQIIGAQIEAQLKRLGRSIPDRFSFESNQSIMAMIAAGAGWAVTTPLSHFRAQRFHGQVRLLPFPGKEFARYISMFSTQECAQSVQQVVENALRNLVETRLIRPAHLAMPWLKDSLNLLPRD